MYEKEGSLAFKTIFIIKKYSEISLKESGKDEEIRENGFFYLYMFEMRKCRKIE